MQTVDKSVQTVDGKKTFQTCDTGSKNLSVLGVGLVIKAELLGWKELSRVNLSKVERHFPVLVLKVSLRLKEEGELKAAL